MIRVLIINNQTASPLSYLSGAVTVPASGSTTVSDDFKGTLAIDGQFRYDCTQNIVQVSDGTNIYGTDDALQYLDQIPGVADKDSRGITSTTIITAGPITHQALDVNFPGGVPISDSGDLVNTYNEVTSIGTSVLTTIVTYTAPIGKTVYLVKAAFSGTNTAAYDIRINSSVQDKKYTYFGGGLSDEFIFNAVGTKGILLTTGDVITIRGIHYRPYIGDFNGRIEVIEV